MWFRAPFFPLLLPMELSPAAEPTEGQAVEWLAAVSDLSRRHANTRSDGSGYVFGSQPARRGR